MTEPSLFSIFEEFGKHSIIFEYVESENYWRAHRIIFLQSFTSLQFLTVILRIDIALSLTMHFGHINKVIVYDIQNIQDVIDLIEKYFKSSLNYCRGAFKELPNEFKNGSIKLPKFQSQSVIFILI